MQTTRPANPRHPRLPIRGFTAAPTRPEPAYTPQHDFLMPNLCPQFTPAPTAPAEGPRRTHARQR